MRGIWCATKVSRTKFLTKLSFILNNCLRRNLWHRIHELSCQILPSLRALRFSPHQTNLVFLLLVGYKGPCTIWMVKRFQWVSIWHQKFFIFFVSSYSFHTSDKSKSKKNNCSVSSHLPYFFKFLPWCIQRNISTIICEIMIYFMA